MRVKVIIETKFYVIAEFRVAEAGVFLEPIGNARI